MPLRKTLYISVSLTMLYLVGFLIKVIGSPVDQFADVLDLIRSVAMTAWGVWAVFFAADRILTKIREQHLVALAAEIGIDEIGARRDRRNGRSAAR